MVGDAITRTPSEVRQLYEEARGKVGALAEVIGGHCVQSGFCPAKFACIGCPANAVDPAKRDQIEHRVGWLTEQRAEAMRLGLPLEVATLERQMRDCHTMLREMEQIEQYRKDEAHGTFIAFDTIG